MAKEKAAKKAVEAVVETKSPVAKVKKATILKKGRLPPKNKSRLPRKEKKELKTKAAMGK